MVFIMNKRMLYTPFFNLLKNKKRKLALYKKASILLLSSKHVNFFQQCLVCIPSY